jgi:hypothetical protein
MSFELYGLPEQFRAQVEGSVSQLQWETRPGFAAAQGHVGGYALGAETSFVNSGLGESDALIVGAPTARYLARSTGVLPDGTVTDPQGALGGSRIIGGEGFRTTHSPDSALSPSAESLPEGVVSMESKEDKARRERYGIDKNGQMSKKGRQLYIQDQEQARVNKRGWESHTEADRTTRAKTNARANDAHGGGRRAGEQVSGGTRQTPKSPVQENVDGTRRLFQRKKD